ncbi:hypothetical protein KKA13_02640 [Patescibacteria group bacterium]|nr:hypothetical protein [Patescibacteria group bacterium]
MPNQPAQQPTVLVKKTDGTFVRMTLDEVKKIKGGRTASSPAPQAPRSDELRQEILKQVRDDSGRVRDDSGKAPTAPVPANLPMVEPEQLPAVSAPFAVYEHPKMPEPVKKNVMLSKAKHPLQSGVSVPPEAGKRFTQDDAKKEILPMPAKQKVKLPDPAKRVANVKEPLPPEAGRLDARDDKMARDDRRPTEILKQVQDDSVKKGIASSPAAPRNDNVALEELPAKNETVPLVSASHGNQVDEIIKKLGFNVPADYLNRLRSLIQLRLKEVRDETQTRETAMRVYTEGGLQLSKEQAKKLVEACRMEKPTVMKGIASSPVAPRNDKGGIVSSPALRAPRNDTGMSPPKPIIRDVVAKPANMGPVDEIRYLSLTDFRRLASDPSEASHRLRQKFIALKDESYLMYLDALRAWHESPLFASYMDAVHSAVVKKMGLEADLTDKSKIQMPEITAIISIERDLI